MRRGRRVGEVENGGINNNKRQENINEANDDSPHMSDARGETIAAGES